MKPVSVFFRLIGRPSVISSWHVRQTTIVLRWRAAIILTHSGFSRPVYFLRSFSPRKWCTSISSVLPPYSQAFTRSRFSSSVRRPNRRCGWSSRTAFVSHFSEMPPHCAMRGVFPSLFLTTRSTLPSVLPGFHRPITNLILPTRIGHNLRYPDLVAPRPGTLVYLSGSTTV